MNLLPQQAAGYPEKYEIATVFGLARRIRNYFQDSSYII
jgi:hypothetical protein